MKPAKRTKQSNTSAPPKAGGKSVGKKQTAGPDMSGMFGKVTAKKPEPDNFTPTRKDIKTGRVASKFAKRLEGVKL